MAYLLDTNAAIDIRDGHPSVLARFHHTDRDVSMSALTFAELQRGFAKASAESRLRQARLTTMLKQIPILPFDTEAAQTYGNIIAVCGWVRGRAFDRMIAAHAISANLTLVTNNVADFADVPGLSLENWAT